MSYTVFKGRIVREGKLSERIRPGGMSRGNVRIPLLSTLSPENVPLPWLITSSGVAFIETVLRTSEEMHKSHLHRVTDRQYCNGAD